MKLNVINDIFRTMLKFNVSKSTWYYLIRNKNKIYDEAISKENIYKDIFGLNKNEMNLISEYIKPPKAPLTIKNILNMWNSSVKNEIKAKDISNFIKKNLNYSYKKGSSTSFRGASRKIHLQQKIFSWRMLKNILMKKYIVNIDESSFNRDIKKEYSWLPRGVTSSIVNQIYSGSKSLISAFWSDGEYVWALLDETVNSDWFQWFLCVIKYFLKIRKINALEDSIIMLDNASYHTSSITKEVMENIGINIFFLPPYSPVLAPVEQFFKLSKSKIRSILLKTATNFSSKAGTKAIINAWEAISLESLQKIWHDFVIILIRFIVE